MQMEEMILSAIQLYGFPVTVEDVRQDLRTAQPVSFLFVDRALPDDLAGGNPKNIWCELRATLKRSLVDWAAEAGQGANPQA